MADLTQQLQQQIVAARAGRRPLQIVGGSSKGFLGRASDINCEKLELAGHSGIVSYHPVELVLTARAGSRLDELQAALDENNQMLSFEPPRFGSGAEKGSDPFSESCSTLGGTLACNLSGPGRPWWGSVRDQVLGIKLLNGRGELLRFGGQVMKNVAGYDVSRLQAGAMGTLGAITEISLKVLPKPAATRTLVFEQSLAEALLAMNRRAGEPKPLSAACWLDGKLYLRLSGAESSVAATAQQWGGEELNDAVTFWQQLRDQQLAFFNSDKPLWRFSVNPSAHNPHLDDEWLLDWGGAQRWFRGEADPEQMRNLAQAAGGQVSRYRGGDRNGEVMPELAAPLRTLHERVKQAFDPDRLFNPGRLYSWL